MYRENPCLWNTKSEDYTNESKRSIAYGLLVEKLWENDENADTETVNAKILSLRESFFEEIKKKSDAIKLVRIMYRRGATTSFYVF